MDSVFYAEIEGHSFRLHKEELHHIRVLRISLPAIITFTDGNGVLYRGTADSDGLINEYEKIGSDDPEHIHIFYGICDRNRERIILEKCTELGVKSFNPIITENAEHFPIKTERARKIIIAAVKQSRRFDIPLYREKQTLKSILDNGVNNGLYGALHGSSEIQLHLDRDISILIGPPSGFTEQEETMMNNAGIMPFHMDSAIMRTETFAVAILSVIKYLQGV